MYVEQLYPLKRQVQIRGGRVYVVVDGYYHLNCQLLPNILVEVKGDACKCVSMYTTVVCVCFTSASKVI